MAAQAFGNAGIRHQRPTKNAMGWDMREAETSISLIFANSDRLWIIATGLTVAFSGKPKFVEDVL